MKDGVQNRLGRLVALGAGLGLMPVAPGTFGTLIGFPLAWGLHQIPLGLAVALLAVAFLGGVVLSGRVARSMGVDDPRAIVMDEYLAFAGLLLAVPVCTADWLWAFLWFRFFDGVKPFPVSWVDRKIKGGLGIMLDDVVAAMMAWIMMRAMVWGGLL